MSFESKEADAQAVYEKLIELHTHAARTFELCRGIYDSEAVESFERANPQIRFRPELGQLYGKLVDIKCDFPKLIDYTTDAGAKTRTFIREDDSSKGSNTMIDPAKVVVQGFEMFPGDVKKQTLKRLFACLDDPPKALGQDGVDTVVALFELLDPREKKQLFQRLMDL